MLATSFHPTADPAPCAHAAVADCHATAHPGPHVAMPPCTSGLSGTATATQAAATALGAPAGSRDSRASAGVGLRRLYTTRMRPVRLHAYAHQESTSDAFSGMRKVARREPSGLGTPKHVGSRNEVRRTLSRGSFMQCARSSSVTPEDVLITLHAGASVGTTEGLILEWEKGLGCPFKWDI